MDLVDMMDIMISASGEQVLQKQLCVEQLPTILKPDACRCWTVAVSF